MKRSRFSLVVVLVVTAIVVVVLQLRVGSIPQVFAAAGPPLPELSAGGAISGISMIIGAALILIDHNRRRLKSKEDQSKVQ